MAVAQRKPSAAPLKDLYDIGEVPPLGHVPANMHAWAIRKERHGPPEQAMQQEVLPTWPIADDDRRVIPPAGRPGAPRVLAIPCGYGWPP